MGGGPHAPGSPIETAAEPVDSHNITGGASPTTKTGIDGLISLVNETNIDEEPSELMANPVKAGSSEGKSTEGQTIIPSQAYQPNVPNTSPVTYLQNSITNPIVDMNTHGGLGSTLSYCQTCGSDPDFQVLDRQGPSETPFQTAFARFSASLLADTSNPSTEYGIAANYPQSATQMRVPGPPMSPITSSIPIHSQTAAYSAQNFESDMASELEYMRVAGGSFNARPGRPTLQQQSHIRPTQTRNGEMAWRQQQSMATQQQQHPRDQQAHPNQQQQDMAEAPQYFRQPPVNLVMHHPSPAASATTN